MALLSWPSSAIMDQLMIAQTSFYLARSRELSRSGLAMYQKDLADPLWMATLQGTETDHDTALQAQALVNTMQDQLATFYVWNPVAPYPKYDGAGTKYLTSAPVVLAKNADNKRLSIGGLVNGYTLSRGDFLAIPSRKCFLQVASASVAANSSGETGLIEVSPFIRTAVTTGDAIVLMKPYVEVMIVPGQDDFIKSVRSGSQISFDVIQVP
jgi:hypothetical protein